MYYPTIDEVKKLATNGNLVPVYKVISADLETPVSVYLKLRGTGPAFLLESVEKGEQLGRYSFLGVEPTGVLSASGGTVTLREGGVITEFHPPNGDPLITMKQILSRYSPVPNAVIPGFTGGLVGYLGYDAVRFFERVPLSSKEGLGLSDAVFLLVRCLVIFDHVKHQLMVVANAYIEDDVRSAYAAATATIDALIDRLQSPLTEQPVLASGALSSEDWQANLSRAAFEERVNKAKEYIRAGDIFQVVLSQCLSRNCALDPFTIYRSLRMLNPSPYMFFFHLPGDVHIIGSSPELLVRLQGDQAEVRPIAGTRPRGTTPDEDEALTTELSTDPKERAEHVMLVDLGRNDLGRVCRYGTISVPELMKIERYSHVMHIVSSVQGTLQLEKDAFDLLRATFPAGTVSGAPKIRAMEIIASLEEERRGPYAGAIGYFSYSGDMDTCIAIRTLIMHGKRIHVQAGAGIVADSDPAREYQETLNKAQALAEAVRLVEEEVGAGAVVTGTSGGGA